MTLHILIFDKFTEPLYHYLTAVLGLQRQQFLFVSAEPLNLTPSENLFLFKSPLSRNLRSNIKTFYKLCSNADRIILHGDPLLHFFALFPSFLKKTSWVIYGQELYSLNKDHGLQNEVKKFVLRKVKNHITHIEGDSILANQMLHSKASFIKSPMYLSNVAETNDFAPEIISQKKLLKVLVGNSTDPTNNHEAIFHKLLKHVNDIECIYCPLSYGMYDEYKAEVIAIGKKMFGDKFIVLEKFMPFEEYKKFLAGIDVIIFDHNRQEGMGVTITLMSLGKIVYVNPHTTSYESLIRRGFKLFDNNLIAIDGLKIDRDVSANVLRLKEYYSKKVFDDSWIKISQL